MAPKRKLPSLGLERRVRARKEEKWEPEPDMEASDSDDELVSEEETGRKRLADDGSEEDEDDSQSGSEEEELPAKTDLSNISFGALARAQASLPPSSKRKNKGSQPDDEDEDEEQDGPISSRKPTKYNHVQRSSKHAPQEVSSKKPVSRRREIIGDNRRQARDPRFDPAVSSGNSRAVQEIKARKAYAFLDEYRDSEIAALKQQIKKTKDAGAREDLKRQLMSMESKRKARLRKDEEEKLLADHRRSEKDAVAQGKKPFYLKKSEQKKQLLLNRYQGMSKGQVDKAIERKRKKVAGKEKKELDSMQRVTNRKG